MIDDDLTERVGTILAIKLEGGLATLMVKNDDGSISRLVGDNGPTCRGLLSIFGREILAAPMVLDTGKLKGKRIGYDTDDMGLLAYIKDPEE